MNDSAQQLILVDGSSYLYRAFHGLPPLSNSKGQATGAIFGVLNMLRSLVDQYQTNFIGVVFDAKGKTFRNDLYPQYKANRPPMPVELVEQIEPLHALVRALGFPLLQVAGVEADDVIGTLARQAQDCGMHTLVSTGDKDFAQLVNEHVTLINTMTGVQMDSAGVKSKFGVEPGQIIDYLALVGDSADNIPGVPKVGPKTAAKWLAEYGDLDAIIGHADQIKGKIGQNLRDSIEQLPLSKQLATILCSVPLEIAPTDLQKQPVDAQQLQTLFRDLEFRNVEAWLGTAATPEPKQANSAQVCYANVLNQSDFQDWLEKLASAALISIDLETTSLNYMQAEIVGVSFAVSAHSGAYVPVGHDYEGAPQQLERDWVLAQLIPILQDPHVEKVGQNLKYDLNVLANYNIEVRGVRFDTMLESYVLDSTSRHDMDSLAEKYLNHRTIHFEEVAGKGAKQVTFNKVALEQAVPYAAEDADITLRLHEHLWQKLQAYEALVTVFETIEMPLLPVLSRMERNGVLVDKDMLAQQSEELAQKIGALESQAHTMADQEFNLGSPKQLQEILFDKLQLPVLQKTPKGQPSTAESVLVELAADYPLPALVLEYRSMSKLKSTYTDKLPQQINPNTQRVHTSYHQAVAATGRLSSSDPNLQNIPIRSAEGRRIRQAFVAPPGYQLLAADYSQIELRIMAHLSADEGLVKAFQQGEDVHRATAAEVFSTAPEQVSNDQRRSAKAINFGLIYGMSAFGLARQLGIDRKAAQQYVDLYFERYPGVKEFMESTRERARADGYVTTVFGRRLYLPEINARNAQRRQYAERTAINAPMQGTAADIIKMAMIEVDGWLQQSGREIKMIMQVHDELVFEVPLDQLDQAREQIAQRMVSVAQLSVPLLVDIGVGENWDQAH